MTDDLRSKKVLVTGGSGFIGRSVLRKLVARNVKPAVLLRNINSDFAEKYRTSIEAIELDLLNSEMLEEIVRKCKPNVIIHLAGSVGKNGESADALNQLNYEVTKNLLKAAREISAEKIVITGTADEYGASPAPQSENTLENPDSDYAISKHRAVEYARSMFKKHRLPVVILRPFTVYGTEQPEKMFLAQALRSASGNLEFEMSAGRQKRDLIFVEDAADAIITASKARNIAGETFNVGGGQAIALRDLAEMIWRLTGADRRLLKVGARTAPAADLHDTQADISKIKKILNWQPKISLEQGIKTIIERAVQKREANDRKISTN